MMTRLRREVVVRGSLVGRFVQWFTCTLGGRRLVECGRCVGTGVERVTRLQFDRPASESHCMFTTCNNCHGVGEVWR